METTQSREERLSTSGSSTIQLPAGNFFVVEQDDEQKQEKEVPTRLPKSKTDFNSVCVYFLPCLFEPPLISVVQHGGR